MTHTLRHIVLGSAAVLVMMVMVGCSYMNPTPELLATARTHGQQINKYTRVIDNNIRGTWDDYDRLLFLDHNLRLTPYPMP